MNSTRIVLAALNKRLAVLATLAVLCLGQSATADTDIPNKPYLSLAAADRMMQAALAYAIKHRAPGASIAIVDDGGHLVMLRRLDNTMPATPPIATGKARTAAIFKTPTARFETIIRDGRTPMLNIEGFTPMRGGVPIIVNEVVIGAIGVSGAASAEQDEEIALAGAAVLGEQS